MSEYIQRRKQEWAEQLIAMLARCGVTVPIEEARLLIDELVQMIETVAGVDSE